MVRAALDDLVLMMRENQIPSARVDIQMLAKGDAGQSRALDVPAWTSEAPRALPSRLIWFLTSLPKRKVKRMRLFEVF